MYQSHGYRVKVSADKGVRLGLTLSDELNPWAEDPLQSLGIKWFTGDGGPCEGICQPALRNTSRGSTYSVSLAYYNQKNKY